MKASRLIVFAVALALGSGVETAQATPLGSEFTYQGQLKDGGIPANGDYDFVFRLYDADTGGAQVGGDVAVDGWPVVDGLFTLQLDFGAGAFTSDARWIEIYVRGSAGGSEYTTLWPRQPVTAAPVALYALDGPGSGGYWTSSGDDIYSTNAGNVGIGTSSPIATLQVVRAADSSADFAIAGYHPDGIGVHGSCDDGYGVFGASGGAGGIGVYGFTVGADSTGVFGVSLGQDGYAGYFNGRGCFMGNVGIKVQDPQASLDVLNYDGLPAVKGVSSGTGVYGLKDSTTGTLPGVWGATESLSSNATGVRGFVNSTAPGAYSAGVRGHNNGTGSLGIGVWGSQDGGGWGVYGDAPDGTGVYGNSANGIGVRGHSDNGYAGYFTGSVRVSVLEITGADVAEKFPVSEEIEPGTVVEIDPEIPGELRMARGAYNRRVAGVVSGAGGIPAGTILGNLPGSEDAPPIALSGRVWVKCDATETPIELGDLLTTSNTPGHAMAVSDFSRAHGAVIGKAMTPLARGETGLVLVLVNLQ